jgi:HSP20 family molecular chaperone IbpA
VYDEGEEFRVVLEVPGARKEGIEISPGGSPGTLVVDVAGSPERKPRRVLLAERQKTGESTRYRRLIPLGADALAAKAQPSLEDGLLTIVVPKKPKT